MVKMKNSDNKSIPLKDFIKDWSEELKLELISGSKSLKSIITAAKVQKPGLRIIEEKIELDRGKIQILGITELSYIEKLEKNKQEKIIEKLSKNEVPCFIFSKGLRPNRKLLNILKKNKITTFSTTIRTGKLIHTLNEILSESFAARTTFHGVLMDIHRVGVLILGKSGIGKSESAIDLIIQGSKLIADDVIEIKRVDSNKLIGSGPDNIRYLMEVRGIGIVNIKDLFGTTSVMKNREIEMVIELDEWNNEKEYDRLGLESKLYEILDINLPYFIIPVSPGRNIASIIEVAVRNQILKMSDEASDIRKMDIFK